MREYRSFFRRNTWEYFRGSWVGNEKWAGHMGQMGEWIRKHDASKEEEEDVIEMEPLGDRRKGAREGWEEGAREGGREGEIAWRDWLTGWRDGETRETGGSREGLWRAVKWNQNGKKGKKFKELVLVSPRISVQW